MTVHVCVLGHELVNNLVREQASFKGHKNHSEEQARRAELLSGRIMQEKISLGDFNRVLRLISVRVKN